MKFRQLEYFCAVAEEKSISAAARELHVAQPPISRQIAQLEEELGVQLFLRGSKGMVLTDAGQNLYQQAQQIFQDLRRVEDSVRSVGTGMSGRIKLGVIYSAMPYALPYINRYHSKYPQVELFIRVGSPQELIESLNRGELHALFLRTAAREPSGLQERILGEADQRIGRVEEVLRQLLDKLGLADARGADKDEAHRLMLGRNAHAVAANGGGNGLDGLVLADNVLFQALVELT